MNPRRCVLILGLTLLAILGLVDRVFVMAQDDKLKGTINADGSSTVYLTTKAMATSFQKLHPDVKFNIGISGTGGGFKKFAEGETDIQDASRAIKPAEAEKCKKNGIEFLELQVGWDGLAVIINKDNNWAENMTVEQLKKIWHPDPAAKKWSDVDPKWPDKEIKLFGPGPDSGTFDYFTEVINGKERVCRTDYTASEDDNVIINGVAEGKFAMGFVGMAYFEANATKLKEVAIAKKAGDKFVRPTKATVLTKQYQPLSRPLFIYLKTASLKRPEVREFARFYMSHPDIVEQSKYVPLSGPQQLTQRKKLDDALK